VPRSGWNRQWVKSRSHLWSNLCSSTYDAAFTKKNHILAKSFPPESVECFSKTDSELKHTDSLSLSLSPPHSHTYTPSHIYSISLTHRVALYVIAACMCPMRSCSSTTTSTASSGGLIRYSLSSSEESIVAVVPEWVAPLSSEYCYSANPPRHLANAPP
jgi:hypothetical protein